MEGTGTAGRKTQKQIDWKKQKETAEDVYEEETTEAETETVEAAEGRAWMQKFLRMQRKKRFRNPGKKPKRSHNAKQIEL